jgi:hypothetical protein
MPLPPNPRPNLDRRRFLLGTLALPLAWGLDAAPPADQPSVAPPAGQENRAEQRRAWAATAATRIGLQIRGLGLGLSLPEAEGRLGSELVAITPERKPDWRPPAYQAYEEVLRLADGSQFSLTFGSPLSGGLAGVLMYEQTLRDGPTPEALLADLSAKYGPPDERGGSGWWLTWHIRSRAPTTDGLGAFLKVHFRTAPNGKVEYFRAVLNDYKFMEQDEHQGAAARREAERQEYEGRKSGQLQF